MSTNYKALHSSVQAADGSIDWSAFAKLLPVGKDEASLKARKKFFRVCDVNSNGLISLAEYDRGLRTFIGSNTLSEKLFKAKLAIARAFLFTQRIETRC